MSLPVLSLMLVVFSLTTGEFVIAGILPDVATGLTVSVPTAGLLVTAYALGMVIGGPVITVLTARVARKPLIIGLVTVSLVGNVSSAVSPSYPVLLLARFLAGSVVATFFAVAVATAISLAPAGKEASTVAKVALGMNLGIIFGTPIGTFVGHSIDWRATFLVVAGASIVALFMVLRFVPVQPATTTGSVVGELRVLLGRDLQLAIALTAVGNLGVVTVFTYISPLLTGVSGFAEASIPVLLLLYGAGAVIGNFLGGWLSDRTLMPSLAGLLAVLTGVFALFWLVATASAAPTLAVAVNASGFQLAAAFAGWLGGQVITSGLGVRSIYLVAAFLTVVGLGIATYTMRRDREPALVTESAS